MTEARGNVDHLGPSPLMGWAWSSARPAARLTVEVSIDGRPAGRAVADRHRPDLEAAGIGDGRHGFELDVAGALALASEQRLEVRCAGSGEPIWSGSSRPLVDRAAELNGLRRHSLWAVTQVGLAGGRLEIGGYLVAGHGSAAPEPVFTLDGEPFAEIELFRHPYCDRLWFVPDSQRLGFRGRSAAGRERTGDSPAVLECRDRRSGRALRAYDSFYLPPDFAAQLASVPDGRRVLRVQGHESAEVHLLWGYTACVKIDELLRRRFGRGLKTFDSILDWGCGCGRLTRHLAALAGPRVTGADVDADNVAWCRDHLAGARFELLPLSPPSALGSSRFDLVLGMSVMTHLRETDQIAWLEELDRLAARGAILLLTINADTAMWWNDPPAELLDEWRQRGFSDRLRDAALDGLIADDAYYRATFHRADYVERVWGDRFEIVEILPAFANIQDLVALRKR